MTINMVFICAGKVGLVSRSDQHWVSNLIGVRTVGYGTTIYMKLSFSLVGFCQWLLLEDDHYRGSSMIVDIFCLSGPKHGRKTLGESFFRKAPP